MFNAAKFSVSAGPLRKRLLITGGGAPATAVASPCPCTTASQSVKIFFTSLSSVCDSRSYCFFVTFISKRYYLRDTKKGLFFFLLFSLLFLEAAGLARAERTWHRHKVGF
jgi:hypothetical protein